MPSEHCAPVDRRFLVRNNRCSLTSPTRFSPDLLLTVRPSEVHCCILGHTALFTIRLDKRHTWDTVHARGPTNQGACACATCTARALVAYTGSVIPACSVQARQLGPVEPQRERLNLERIAVVVDLLNNFPTRALADRLPVDMPADSVRTALQAVPGVMAATVLDLDAAGAPLAVAASATVDPAAAVRAPPCPPACLLPGRPARTRAVPFTDGRRLWTHSASALGAARAASVWRVW